MSVTQRESAGRINKRHLRTCAASAERKQADVNANTVTPLQPPRGCEATARTIAGCSGVLHMQRSTRPWGSPGTDRIFSLRLERTYSISENVRAAKQPYG